MVTKRNSTTTTDAKLATVGKKVGVIPQTKLAADKLTKDTIRKSNKELSTKGVVVPVPSHPHPFDPQVTFKPSKR